MRPSDFFSNTPVLFRNFDQLTASRLNSAYKFFLQLQFRHADASPHEIAQLAQALQSDDITNEDTLADALITSATTLQNEIIASAVQKYLQQLKLFVRPSHSIIHLLEAEPQPAFFAPSAAPVQVVQASSQNPPAHVLMVRTPSPSNDEDGEIIEFLDADQWQEHQASIATSTALASTATASPEATDQQNKRVRRIAHPSDPLTPSPPEIVPVQPGRMLRRIRTAS